jgi:hypothetical protein
MKARFAVTALLAATASLLAAKAEAARTRRAAATSAGAPKRALRTMRIERRSLPLRLKIQPSS